MAASRALIVSDAPEIQQQMTDVLHQDRVRATVVGARDEGIAWLDRESFQVLFVDLDVPGVDDEFVRRAVSIQPRLSVVVLADRNTIDLARCKIQVARTDYLAKPTSADDIRAAWGKAFHRFVGQRPAQATPASNANGNGHSGPQVAGDRLIAQSPAMRDVVNLVARIAPTDVTVLIQGEPGTGKGRVARDIHNRSRRAGGPFVRVACEALQETELNEKLFGEMPHGANENGCRPATLLERARGGTVYLENVFELPFWAQAKLLDILRQNAEQRSAESADVRILASTEGDLEAMIAQHRCDLDLYYYLDVVRIRVPALRQRPQGILALADHFLIAADTLRTPGGSNRLHFSEEARESLLHYNWPGNVVQLANVIARAAVLAEGDEIGREHITEAIGTIDEQPVCDSISIPFSGGLKEMERFIVAEAIRRCHGNKAAAARTLRLHRRTLYRLLDSKANVADVPPWPVMATPSLSK